MEDLIIQLKSEIKMLYGIGSTVIGGLITALAIVWKRLTKEQDYIKLQDKENVKLLEGLLNVLSEVESGIKLTLPMHLKEFEKRVSDRLDDIRTHLKL